MGHQATIEIRLTLVASSRGEAGAISRDIATDCVQAVLKPWARAKGRGFTSRVTEVDGVEVVGDIAEGRRR